VTRRALLPLAAVLVLAAAVPVSGYLKLGTRAGDRTVTLRWTTLPVRYFVANRGTTGVTANELEAIIARAFATWHAVDVAQTSSQFAGLTPAPPVSGDDMTVLGFASRPDLDRVLGATSFIVDVTTGQIIESDIFFNTAFPWSVAAAGETGRHDLESIAVHEIGHLLGLGHSAIGETEVVAGRRRVIASEAVMFPIAFAPGSTVDRTLKPDDIAGLTDIYPTPESRRSRGSISGRVTRNGTGVSGAHVVAFNPRSGALVGGFTLNDEGTFTIAGLDPGPHVLRVEPLDDADVESFFDSGFDVDAEFRVGFHNRIVVVPQGGGTRNIEIAVTAR